MLLCGMFQCCLCSSRLTNLRAKVAVKIALVKHQSSNCDIASCSPWPRARTFKGRCSCGATRVLAAPTRQPPGRGGWTLRIGPEIRPNLMERQRRKLRFFVVLHSGKVIRMSEKSDQPAFVSVVAVGAEDYSEEGSSILISLRRKYSTAERKYSVPVGCFRDLIV